jgi:pimeloyl-ACP methyl ester carboxylesterase
MNFVVSTPLYEAIRAQNHERVFGRGPGTTGREVVTSKEETVGESATRKWILGALSIGTVLGGVWIYRAYRRDLRAARQRVAAGRRVLETDLGPLEYGVAGHGPPALVIHGAGGGYDQGLLLGEFILGDEFTTIAPSRFGYLGTPIPEEPTLAAQADAFARLLDELGVERAIVVPISAGGPPGLEFALRYPERTEALVMTSAISLAGDPEVDDEQRTEIINRIVGSDLVYWLAMKVARRPLLSLLGVSPQVQARLAPDQMAYADRILEEMLPMSDRMPGILLDQSRVLPPDYPIEEIAAPTLVIHARDDALVDFANGQHTADAIPDAEFIVLEDGGHFLMGHFEQLREQVDEFLNRKLLSYPDIEED